MHKNTTGPDVSIVIVSYNCQDVISQCIASCIAVPIAETIVIDNDSKDGSVSIIRKFANQIKFYEEKVNHGFTKGCNIGIDAAKGKYILLLNPDASLTPGAVENLMQHLENDLSLGAVAPTLIYPDGSFQNYTRTFPTVSGLAVEHFVPRRYQAGFRSFRKYLCLDKDFTQDQYVDQPAGAAFMFRNNGMRLDEQYFIYGSDVELCKNIKVAGFKIKQVTNAKVLHHQSKGGTHLPNLKLKTYLDLDNYYGMSLYFKRHEKFMVFLGYKLIFTFGLALSILPGLIRGRKATYYRVKRLLSFLRGENFTYYIK